MKIEHKLGYLALIGNIAPMVGLLGTVDGMVIRSAKLREASRPRSRRNWRQEFKPHSTRLWSDLMIAIPAIICYNLLRNRVQRMVAEAGNESEAMIDKFELALRQEFREIKRAESYL